MASKNRKDISRARRMQDDYALAERRYASSKARGKKVLAPHETARARSLRTAGREHSRFKNEGRVEGFLAGALTTAIAWLWTTRKSWMGA